MTDKEQMGSTSFGIGRTTVARVWADARIERLRKRGLSLARHPLFLITTFFTLVAIIVGPWGDYPLNDDWVYARIVKHLAETGDFKSDTVMAASLVGQAYLAAGFVKLFGFSHTLLRLITMVASVLLLWTIDNILRLVGARTIGRVLACALLVLNPVFLSLAFSFMTEIYGYLLAFLAVWLWFAHRKRHGSPIGQPVASVAVCAGVAALIGASFWVRQFCVAVLPALFGSSLLLRCAHRDWAGILRSIPGLLVSAVLFIGIVGMYLFWSKTTGTYPADFGGRFGGFLDFKSQLWWLTTFEALVYLTAFFFPFLALVRHENFRPGMFVGLAFLTMAIIVTGKQLQPQFAGFHHHVEFPYSANLVNNGHIGTITLSSEYLSGNGIPRWTTATMKYVEWCLWGLAFGWSYFWSVTRLPHPRPRELRHFCLIFAVIAFGLYVQSSQSIILDRYYFPWILAAVVLFASSLLRKPSVPSLCSTRLRAIASLLSIIPLAWYTLAGTHDYFRWNDARWALVRKALTEVEPNNLDGGYEVNGWLNLDYVLRKEQPKHCVGVCSCRDAVAKFFCTDDTYKITLLSLPSRDIIATENPSFWMIPSMPLYLTKRRN